MRYLVTGGCGFIGSHSADMLLAAGHEGRILDDLSSGALRNKPVSAELIVGDVTDFATVEAAMRGADGVFHFAAVSSVEGCNRNWIDAHHTNLTGTITAVAAARSAKNGGPIPVVYPPSAAVSGTDSTPPPPQAPRPRPAPPYGLSNPACALHAH